AYSATLRGGVTGGWRSVCHAGTIGPVSSSSNSNILRGSAVISSPVVVFNASSLSSGSGKSSVLSNESTSSGNKSGTGNARGVAGRRDIVVSSIGACAFSAIISCISGSLIVILLRGAARTSCVSVSLIVILLRGATKEGS